MATMPNSEIGGLSPIELKLVPQRLNIFFFLTTSVLVTPTANTLLHLVKV